MARIPFSVSARTARLIGRENVANAEGAVIELVKNSYDADADNVTVFFSGDEELYIIDNGHGMTEEIIKSAWMTIGTDHKEIDPFSPRKRVKSGAKGIGRFALDRLGEKVEMYTLPKGADKGFLWKADWSDFEKAGTNVSDIKASLEEIEKKVIAQQLPEFYKDSGFSKQGTVLKISKLRDTWDEKLIAELYESLESLVPGEGVDNFSISLNAFRFPDKFGHVKPLLNQDFDYRIDASYSSKTQKVTVTVERNEFDIPLLEKKFSELFLDTRMDSEPYRLADFKKGSFKKIYSIGEIISGYSDPGNLIENIGDFSFKLTFAKNRAPNKEDAQKYPYKSFEYAARSEWLERFSGIRIFRDNFRVRPYGEKGDDWLHLGERAALSPAGPGQRLNGYRVRPNQVYGAVYISRLQNLLFQDKSSREGIQENDTFSLFKNLLISIVGVMERDRNIIFFSLSELHKRTNEAERIKAEAREAAERIKKEKDQPSSTDWNFSEDAEKVARAFQVLEGEIEEKHEEIKILRSLASAGLITAAVAHELRGLENVLVTRNQELRSLIEPYIKEADLAGVKDAFNPFVLIKEMEQTDKNLREWLSYALMPLKRDKRKRAIIFLSEYFAGLGNTWSNLLAERKISLDIGSVDESYRVKAFHIDLDTIFNNLVINSIESFARQKKSVERKIQVQCSYHDDRYRIIYTDNGAGLDESFKKNPDIIFEPQITTKVDSEGKVIGTGMGMYLVKNTVEENGGSVEFLETAEGFSIAITLVGK